MPTTRSRASKPAPTYTSAARSAMLRPCLAVVRAAVALALAAWRVWFFAVVRVRRPVDLLGALLAAVLRVEVERVVLRVDVLRVRVDLARVPVLRVEVDVRAGLRAVEFVVVRVVLVVLGVSAILADSAPLIAGGNECLFWVLVQERTRRTYVRKPCAT